MQVYALYYYKIKCIYREKDTVITHQHSAFFFIFLWEKVGKIKVAEALVWLFQDGIFVYETYLGLENHHFRTNISYELTMCYCQALVIKQGTLC